MLTHIFSEHSLHLQEKYLCLDFMNTVNWHVSDHPEETLRSFADLVNWAKEVGLITESSLQDLLLEAASRPEAAMQAFHRSIDLREAIYQLFLAYLGVRSYHPQNLDLLNRVLFEWSAELRLVRKEDGFGWSWTGDAHRLDGFLGPVAQSAAELLTSAELSRVGICADETGCGWLFYDTSRNHSRRWCDMRGCGNRAKARQHYQRAKKSVSTILGDDSGNIHGRENAP